MRNIPIMNCYDIGQDSIHILARTSELIMSKLVASSHGWKHGLTAHPYHADHHHHRHHMYDPRRSSTHQIAEHDATKDKEFEAVMTAIQLFFARNANHNELQDGVSKTELCEFVLSECRRFTISKFRFALNGLLRLKLVSTMNGKIKIPDDIEDCGAPERVCSWRSMEDELECIADMAVDGRHHTESKNIKCFFCSKAFYDRRGLKQHCMQSHHRAFGLLFKCSRCTHKFRTEDALTEHMHDAH